MNRQVYYDIHVHECRRTIQLKDTKSTHTVIQNTYVNNEMTRSEVLAWCVSEAEANWVASILSRSPAKNIVNDDDREGVVV